MRKFGMLILAAIAFFSGVIITFQYVGKDHGVSVFKMLKKPDIIEKEIKVPVYKVLIVSDDSKIVVINSEYRDALLKIAQGHDDYTSIGAAEDELKKLIKVANDALKIPEQFAEAENGN